jgi:UDP-N-acetyl-D-mannosaminuronic acid dehydrogenase
LGYIGLPTAAMLANHGHEVVGYDPSEQVVDRLQDGNVGLEEPGLRAFVGQALQSGNLSVSSDPVPAEYHVICVPTPLDESNQADLGYVETAGETVSRHLREGDTVILESTVPPGTTTDVLRPLLEQSGLTAGEEFALVFCPETVLPGDIIHELRSNDRIVGGLNGDNESAVELYRSFLTGDIHTTDATTAEFVKLIQNTYRDVNIAFANETARRCYDLGIDSREVIDLANNHPRVDILDPGPGVGGHCLPVDPYFLLDDDEGPSLISVARQTNDGMADHVLRLLEDLLDDLDGRKVAILGVAYKGNVSDARSSPGLLLAERLQSGYDVELALTDPHVDDQTIALQPLGTAVADADAAVVVTDHDEYRALDPSDLDGLRRPVVVDTKAVLDPERWEAAGFTLERI